ncbi:MAG: NCS1 family nucleobase:cation symporter-1 [Phycisphaerales bacterium]|nr:NCS1 family nucleobase:cation symporter-1 [Phycisphaerales bacterium]
MPTTLSNADLAPTTPAQRTWSTWHIAALWIGMAVCIPTYTLAAGMIERGMSWWQATLTVLLGNLIVLVPMILNGHAGAKYGIPFPVLMRASFGIRGANIPAIARALVACGWFGIQSWIGGDSIYQVLGGLGWVDIAADRAGNMTALGLTPWQGACFLAFWLINVHFVWHGINSIKWLESWAAPFLIAAGLALMTWAIVKVGDVSVLFGASSKFADNAAFWAVFVPQLTAMVGFWATLSLNIPDFTRFAKSQKAQVWGQALGLPPTMTLFCFIGIIVTSATTIIFHRTIWDPVEVVARLGSVPVIIISLVMLSVATLTTNIAANVVSPANDFSNLNPRRISFRMGGMITAIIGILMMPWYLYNNLGAYIFTWLIGYSALLGPIAGIMLCDYYVIRRTRLDVEALYDPAGPYSYTRGINRRAVVALVLAVVPNIPGFINAASHRSVFPAFFDAIYGYAWFTGLALAMGIYYVLMAGKSGGAAGRSGTLSA